MRTAQPAANAPGCVAYVQTAPPLSSILHLRSISADVVLPLIGVLVPVQFPEPSRMDTDEHRWTQMDTDVKRAKQTNSRLENDPPPGVLNPSARKPFFAFNPCGSVSIRGYNFCMTPAKSPSALAVAAGAAATPILRLTTHYKRRGIRNRVCGLCAPKAKRRGPTGWS